MKRTKTIMVVSLFFLTVTMLPAVYGQETTEPLRALEEKRQQLITLITSDSFQNKLSLLKHMVEPYLDEATQKDIELKTNDIVTQVFGDWEYIHDGLVSYIRAVFEIIIIISELLFGMLLGRAIGILLCITAYIVLSPLMYIYLAGWVPQYLTINYEIDTEWFELDTWVYACGIIVGPILWVSVILLAVVLSIPVSLVIGLFWYLIEFFPVFSESLTYALEQG